MKILSLRLSNILSFRFHENPEDAERVDFDSNLNIIIGQNGAGKSTALEALNFFFRRVILKRFTVNHDLYGRRAELTAGDRKQIFSPANDQGYTGFRLDPNWNTEDKKQFIIVDLELDDVDKANMASIRSRIEAIAGFISIYSNHQVSLPEICHGTYMIRVELHRNSNSFTSTITPDANDSGVLYVTNYNFYRDLINFHNIEQPQDAIPQLYDSFVLIGGYRNYTSFSPSVSLQESTAGQQIQGIIGGEYGKSLNASESSEPGIFSLVRLRVAEKHFDAFGVLGFDACITHANEQEFLTNINEKLKMVNLRVQIDLKDKQKWGYSFNFFDLKRQRQLSNINALSAGQKAIIHLIFEAYGRGEVKGGLILIDEPELHLHYQFQNEYLKIVEMLNSDQRCQYILVTHSEALINSKTIHRVKRFSLDDNNYSLVKSPVVTADAKTLVKILDNTKAGFAFFASRVLLVEGETDRYFFKSFVDKKFPSRSHELAIIDIEGKGNRDKWSKFFADFGLRVYFIGDLDTALTHIYGEHQPPKIRGDAGIAAFHTLHPDALTEIEKQYDIGVFILKHGDLETYLNIHNKGLPEVIALCNNELEPFLSRSDKYTTEIDLVIARIMA